MSKDNVKKFFEEIEKNPALKEKFLKSVKESHEEAQKKMTVTMVDFAKASGFTFAESDLRELNSDLMDSANSNGELSDNDLMKASGGGAGQVILSIISLGIGCGVVSAIAESSRSGGCGKFFKS